MENDDPSPPSFEAPIEETHQSDEKVGGQSLSSQPHAKETQSVTECQSVPGKIDEETPLIKARNGDPDAMSSADEEETKSVSRRVEGHGVKPPSKAHFAQAVLRLLTNIEEQKISMPLSILNEIDGLADIALAVAKGNSLVVSRGLRWRDACRVNILTMDYWKENNVFHPRPRANPIIQAFYSSTRIPTTSSERPTRSTVMATTRDLQRVHINSYDLLSEFRSILGKRTPNRMLIAPPFKVLVAFLPELDQRLADLRRDLPGPQRYSIDPNRPESDRASDASSEKPEDNSEIGDDGTATTLPWDYMHNGYDPNGRVTKKFIERNIAHLETLLSFIRNDLSETISLRSEIAAGTLENIAFEDLWHLFKPGDLVLSTVDPDERLYKVFAVTGGQLRKRGYSATELDEKGKQSPEERVYHAWTTFHVDLYSMELDGGLIQPLKTCQTIRHYAGTRPVRDLPIYPMRFHPGNETIRRRLEDRGRKMITAYGHWIYEGIAREQYGQALQNVESDVFIDQLGSIDAPDMDSPRYHRGSRLLVRTTVDVTETSDLFTGGLADLTDNDVDEKLCNDFFIAHRGLLEPMTTKEAANSSEHLSLLPPTITGYAFRNRAWFHLYVDQLKPIDHETRALAFNDLVIPKRYRDLLVALVDNHSSQSQPQKDQTKRGRKPVTETEVDLVKGKGQGLIILLHGPPGSGKTSTAETMAAYTRRPLYSITCGDIGLTPREVEKGLHEHTTRADKWGCVLLLDEADVFLMQRDFTHMERNALVTAFLRELEYYSGIMFLTTNRPGVIDEAFKSRIHITLRYPSIDLDSTKQMWTNIMNRIARDNTKAEVKIVFDKDELLEFAEKHYRRHERDGTTWNGRQIRNAFRTALALGHHQRLARLRPAKAQQDGSDVEQASVSRKKKPMVVRLTKAHFRNISRTTDDFEAYMVWLRGHDHENVRDAEVRDDHFDMDLAKELRRGASALTAGKMAATGSKKAKLAPAKGKKDSFGKRRKSEARDEEDDDDVTSSDEEESADDDEEDEEDEDSNGDSDN